MWFRGRGWEGLWDVGFCVRGRLGHEEGVGNALKVHFYSMSDHCLAFELLV